MRLLFLAGAFAAASLLAVACGDSEPVVTQDIVSTIPWPDQERTEYVLLDSGGEEERGTGVLSVTRQGNTYELRLEYESETNEDKSQVVVDAATLKPVSMRRELRTEDESAIVEGEYDAAEMVLTVTQIDDEGDERSVPQRLEEHYYDNESSLYLWRAIRFEEGYEASYSAALANQGTNAVVTVEVTGKEEITVPAGTFQTWRVEVRSGGVEQTAWYADTPDRQLVQFENENVNLLMQLRSVDGG